LLGYIKQTLLTPEVVEKLVKEANRYILELQSKAPEDITPLRTRLDELRRSRDRLIDLIAKSLDPSLDAVRGKLTSIDQEMSQIKRRIQQVREQKESQIAPLTRDGVMSLLDKVGDILNQDVPNANEALRELLGTVAIHQVIMPGRKLATWIAEIKADLGSLLAHAGRFSKTPDASNLMKLIGRKWSFEIDAKITLDTPQLRRDHLTQSAEHLLQSGMPIHEVALRTGTTPEEITEIDRMMRWKATPKSRQKRTAEYVKRADEVGQLVRAGMPIASAAIKLGISTGIAYRAWHYFRHLEGGAVPIDLNMKFPYELHAKEAAELYQSGISKKQIAKRLGISRPTVRHAILHYQRTLKSTPSKPNDDS